MNASAHSDRASPLAAWRLPILLLFLLASGFLLWRLGAEQYQFPDLLYLLLNGFILLRGGVPIILRSLRILLKEGRLTPSLLLSIVILAAAGTGLWLEAALVTVIAATAAATEQRVATLRRNPSGEGLLSPDTTVRVKRDHETVNLPLSQIEPGHVLIVQEGESIPADGTILFGDAQISEAAITGEASFSSKSVGATVFAGSVIAHGFIEMRVQQAGSDTLLAQVERKVEAASGGETLIETLLEKVIGILIPVILGAGLFVFLYHLLTSEAGTVHSALRVAMTVIIVLSPAALVVATPAAVWRAVTEAAHKGILFRSGAFLETLADMKTLLIDKTGTLTTGRPAVVDVAAFGNQTPPDVLAAALFVEQKSRHPLARTIMDYGRDQVGPLDEPDRFLEFEGGGACAIKGDRHIKVGAFWLMEDGREIPDEVTEWIQSQQDKARMCVLVADQTRILGGIALEDTLRPEAKGILTSLRRAGVRKMVMLTGDNAKAAHTIAVDLGMNEYVSECMPDTKFMRVRKEQSYLRSGAVVMVGDGINDAPALAEADVGIAMGALGTALAVDAAPVTLLQDRLDGLLEAYRISRKCSLTIRLNLVVAGGIGLALAILAALGHINLLVGAVLQQATAALLLLPAIWTSVSARRE